MFILDYFPMQNYYRICSTISTIPYIMLCIPFIMLYVSSGVSIKELHKGDISRKTIKLFSSVWLVDKAKWADIYISARCPLVTRALLRVTRIEPIKVLQLISVVICTRLYFAESAGFNDVLWYECKVDLL